MPIFSLPKICIEKLIDVFMMDLLSILERIFPPSTSSQARQGCSNNPLEVFSFLAFGLYLVNLAMGLGGGGRRRRRSTKSQDLCQEDDISDRPELMQSIMAFTEMFRAYLAVDDLSGEVHMFFNKNLYAKEI